MIRIQRRERRRGFAMVIALVMLGVLILLAASLVQSVVHAHRQAHRHHQQAQAIWLADAALGRGVLQLQADRTYAGEVWLPPAHTGLSAGNGVMPLPLGRASIRVEKSPANPDQWIVHVEAIVPDHPTQRVRQVRSQIIRLPSEGDAP